MPSPSFEAPFTALHSAMVPKRKRRSAQASRTLSVIPEELSTSLPQQQPDQRLDSLVASVFGTVDWDEGQDEVDLGTLYRLQRPDLNPATRSQRSRAAAPVFGLVDWARQAAMEAQEPQQFQTFQRQSSPIACTARTRRSTPTSESGSQSEDDGDLSADSSDDEEEGLVINVARSISVSSVIQQAQRPAPRAPRSPVAVANFRLPFKLQTYGLESPMMTPVNTPLSTVTCF